uniref:GIY-YIG domain-containing protein n=1 Tax=Ditylenchus dipsaci TaxID=166011 RepID=A0A915EQX5_9BILA
MSVCTRSYANRDEQRCLRLSATGAVAFAFHVRALSQVYGLVVQNLEATKNDLFRGGGGVYGNQTSLSHSLSSICKFLNVDLKMLHVTNCPATDFAVGNFQSAEAMLEDQSDFESGGFSVPLELVIRDEEMGAKITTSMGEFQEHILRNRYLFSSAGKNEVSFFCYLLLDPSMLSSASSCDLRQFVSAIFYVGKGKHSRPLQHLNDANRCRSLLEDDSYQPTEKLKRILELWDNGHGVISLHLSHNIHSAEAFVREGSMIEAIGIHNLTNMAKANFRGLPTAWTKRQIQEFGAMLLRKAHVIFRNERCRPVYEADIAV